MKPLKLEQESPRPMLAAAQTVESEDGLGKTEVMASVSAWTKVRFCPPSSPSRGRSPV